jgi:hypothetical protein
VLREVDSANLAVAMKSASEPLREKIYASISKRAAESLRDEISMLGPVRLKDVETAQDAIIQVVRRLEEEGSISLEANWRRPGRRPIAKGRIRRADSANASWWSFATRCRLCRTGFSSA